MHECNMIGCVYSFVLASLMSVARLSQPRNSTLSSHMIQKPPRGAHQNVNSISKIFALRTKGCACKRYCTENAYHLAFIGASRLHDKASNFQIVCICYQSHLHRNTSLPSPMLWPSSSKSLKIWRASSLVGAIVTHKGAWCCARLERFKQGWWRYLRGVPKCMMGR